MKLPLALLLLSCLAAPATILAQAPSPPPVSAEAEYRLGPEDIISIQVWGRADLTGAATVDFSGKIQLPLVGQIDARGRTPAELGKYLTERYQLLDPSIPEVLVGVSQYNSQAVSVVGEVRSPGRYGFRTIPDLWAVILKAGGSTRDADLAHVQVVRESQKEGGSQTVMVDLSRGIDLTARANLPTLLPNDNIVLPSLLENALPGDKFQVLGAVRSPGVFRIGVAGSIIEAISASGGTLPEADLRDIRLTRPTKNGALSYHLDLQGYLDDARPIADLKLKPGDTITVPSRRSTMRSVMDGIGKISPLVSIATVAVTLIRLSR